MTGPVDPRFTSVTALDRQVAQQAKAEWYRMSLTDLQGSFANQFVPAVVPDLTMAQAAAATLGASHVGSVTKQPSTIIPGGFAGYASDGRSLPGLLAQPLIEMYSNLDNGMDASAAMDRGWDSIDRMLAGQVHDSARQAESVQMVEHRVTYWVRHVEPGACSRCILLSGKHYKVNEGFLRHEPTCRCYHVPMVSTYLDSTDGVGRGELISNGIARDTNVFHGREARSPREIFDSLPAAEQDRAFTTAGAQAIRDGASIPQVVNSRRSGMSTVTDRYGTVYKTTTVGAKRGKTRLLPEACAKAANGDRDEWLRLLRKNGYLLD